MTGRDDEEGGVPAADGTGDDDQLTRRLASLDELRSARALSDEEYAAARGRLLDGGTAPQSPASLPGPWWEPAGEPTDEAGATADDADPAHLNDGPAATDLPGWSGPGAYAAPEPWASTPAQQATGRHAAQEWPAGLAGAPPYAPDPRPPWAQQPGLAQPVVPGPAHQPWRAGPPPARPVRPLSLVLLCAGVLALLAFWVMPLFSAPLVGAISGPALALRGSGYLWLVPVAALAIAVIGGVQQFAAIPPGRHKALSIAALVVALLTVIGYLVLLVEVGDIASYSTRSLNAADLLGAGFWLTLLMMVASVIAAGIDLARTRAT